MGCMVSINDLADRPPVALADGDVMDLGGKQVRYLSTPHVPHGWDAGLLFEESTSTLLCGDLSRPRTGQAGQRRLAHGRQPSQQRRPFGYSSLTPGTAATIKRLAELQPARLALMHGSAHHGDASGWLTELASYYDT